MIKIKLNSLTNQIHDFPRYQGERVSEIIERVYKEFGLPVGKLQDQFKVFINGVELDRKLWCYVKPKDSVEILIVLVPKGSDTGRLLGQIAVAVAAIYTGGAWGAVIAIAGSFAVNQLFPPPSISLGGSNNKSGTDDSQMYNITSQSNQVAKYGKVPKVYGTHRIFPNVAAAPYTEYEVSEKGELVQYFYGLYDLGLGPMNVREIKIGNTDIEFFEEAYYRLVDFNAPENSQGEWDDVLAKDLSFYKGDNSVESISVNINTNAEDPGADPGEYEVIRNANENGDALPQEIILDFGFPQGLNTLGTNGDEAKRTVELDIQFAEVGTENWKPFNSEADVLSFSAVGDSVAVQSPGINLSFLPRSNTNERFHRLLSILSVKEFSRYQRYQYPIEGNGFIRTSYDDLGDETRYFEDRYGLKKGTKVFYSDTYIAVNNFIKYGNQVVGKVKARSVYSGSVYRYELFDPFPYDIYVYRDFTRYTDDNSIFIDTYVSYYLNNQGLSKPPFMSNVIDVVEGSAGIFRISGKSNNPVYASVRFSPATTSQVKVRVRRVRSYGGYTYRVFDDMAWINLNTRLDREPIVTNERHVFIEVKIKATDQLNGTIDNLSAVCSSVLPCYDANTSSWVLAETSNPAWIFADILTGKINKRAIDKSRLDVNSLVEWSEFCDEIPQGPPGTTFLTSRFSQNFVLDAPTTVMDIINQVTSACQASINVINGKYGVLVDKLKSVPVQVFTPRNSWGFSSTRNYVEPPDAYKVKYVDPGREWGVYEEIVYSEGKDSSNSLSYESLDSFGCTNPEQAWRMGRYFQVSAILRQENIQITVDFEHLVCTRGDYVKLQHDVMKVGGRPARVSSVVGNVITIDDSFITEPGVDYGFTCRNATGIFDGTINVLTSRTAEVTSVDLPNVGDLIVWGEIEKITIDCLVKTITPNDDLSAQLVLIEKADAVYEAESTSEFPEYDPQLVENVDSESSAPGPVENLDIIDSSYICGSGSYIYYVRLSWSTPIGSVVDQYEVYVDSGNGFKLVDFTNQNTYDYLVDSGFLGVQHRFKVIGVAANGSKINIASSPTVSVTPVRKTAPPSDVPNLYINILNETLQLDWDPISDCGTSYYLIRYSPNVNASWSSSIPLQVVDRNTSLASFQARVGSYFIKAIDWEGNQSENAAKAITSIPSLTNINIIEETNDFPDLNGSLDLVQKFGNELILKEKNNSIPGVIEYYDSGYYYYQNLLDLGEIYTIRLQSLIQAEGFSVDDLMVNWPSLSSLVSLSYAQVSDWNVETQYRATTNYNVMSEWDALVNVDTLSVGIIENWTPWRKFTIGDFTGRIFQFRLKLISNKPAVTPRVFDGIIKADMPDRVENFNNVTTTDGVARINYIPEFKGPGLSPNIQITQDNAQQGDRFEITNKTLTGFDIAFYDVDDNLVDRQFDVLVKGYGRKQNEVI